MEKKRLENWNLVYGICLGTILIEDDSFDAEIWRINMFSGLTVN